MTCHDDCNGSYHMTKDSAGNLVVASVCPRQLERWKDEVAELRRVRGRGEGEGSDIR